MLAKRDDPILSALVYPILPGIGMVSSNCDILFIAHSHEKLLYAKILINLYYILTKHSKLKYDNLANLDGSSKKQFSWRSKLRITNDCFNPREELHTNWVV